MTDETDRSAWLDIAAVAVLALCIVVGLITALVAGGYALDHGKSDNPVAEPLSYVALAAGVLGIGLMIKGWADDRAAFARVGVSAVILATAAWVGSAALMYPGVFS